MSVSATFKFQVSSMGSSSYYFAVAALTVLGYWRLGEGSGTTAVDETLANNGTYVGSPTLGVPVLWTPDGNAAVTFDGVNDNVTMGDVAAFRFTGAFSVSAWVKYTTIGTIAGIVTKSEEPPGAAGWGLELTGAGQFQFYGYTAASAVVFDISTTLAYNDGRWHHVACTWDGTTGANKVIIYVDGTSVKTGTAVAGTLGTGAYPFRIGARGVVASLFFTGTIDEVMVIGSVLTPTNVTDQSTYLTEWVDTYTTDWQQVSTTLTRGMADNTPTSRVAAPGTAEFTLDNSNRNVGSQLGYYSPDHAGFNGITTYGRRVRFLATYNSVDYVLWSGRIRSLLPVAGTYKDRIVHATAHDAMGDLSLFTIKEITAQIGQTETALIALIAAALPLQVQPQVLLDSTKETYAYALDDMGDGAGNGLDILHSLVISAWGWCWVNPYNVIKYRNRTNQAAKTFTATLADSDIQTDGDGLIVDATRASIFNRVRVTVHPRHVDAAATTVLCSGAGQLVPAGTTVTIWLDYRNPDTTSQTIGATAVVTPLVATTHYLANANADGSGANLTASISIVTTAFASTAKFAITNASGTDAYMTLLQLLGKGIYDDGPVTYDRTASAVAFYDNVLEVDMPYKAVGVPTGGVGADYADFHLANYSVLGGPLSEVTFNPQRSSTLMGYALTMDIGDVVDVTEVVTGMTNRKAVIVGIQHEISPGPLLTTRWTLATHIPTAYT